MFVVLHNEPIIYFILILVNFLFAPVDKLRCAILAPFLLISFRFNSIIRIRLVLVSLVTLSFVLFPLLVRTPC